VKIYVQSPDYTEPRSSRRTARQREEREQEEASPSQTTVVEKADGLYVGPVRIGAYGEGGQNLTEEQLKAVVWWCEESGRPNVAWNIRRRWKAVRENAERERREEDEKRDARRRRDLLMQAVRDVEHAERARDDAELRLGRLVAEDASAPEVHIAESALGLAEKQVVRVTAKAKYLRRRAAV
jgi:hypothetical protein